MRYLFVLLLAGCTATQWTKEGATNADLDRDYVECQQMTKSDPAIPAILAGAFGAVGVFAGVSHNDSKIRACLQARGWAAPGKTNDPKVVAPAAATPNTPTPTTPTAITPTAITPTPAATMAEPVKTVEPESPAAKRLRELKSLLDQGLITKEEYEERRQVVLRSL